MTIRITEDEDESGGYAFINLGRPLASPLLSFRRQDTEPRHLGAEGWQPEVAWLAPLAVTERDGRAVARFGPNVVDRIEELVPIEIVAQDGTSFGVVAWPFIPPAPSGGGILAGLPAAVPTLTRDGTGGPAVPVVPLPEPEPAPPQDAAPAAPPAPEPAARKSRLLWPLVALMLLALAAGGAYLYRDRLSDIVARREASAPEPSPPPAPPEPDSRLTAAELRQRYARLVDERAPAGAFLALGETALASRQGSAAFRAFEEADPVTSADAAWQLARFYDPGNADTAYREAARPDVVRAAYYYALWRNRSPRHTEALRALCEGSAAIDRLRAICRP
ncbi:hypothetical protein [Methylobacterium radiotolerans]|uniref:hypothetical protein n=1 Tax=Methylobacterium radiotolerans TaxID=31998 RepID=UPI0007A612A8|nr:MULTISPECIES: hypothetical protein [Methylobacterium]KZC01933.1 hypothetical protein AU375_01842 [Methylobacterium radiotolerans]MDE3744445.1 hypothetical protein [Methylobacterium radiotolerans]PVY96295.1 hypothetical protein C7388_12098 [Methylobacterium organophilum]